MPDDHVNGIKALWTQRIAEFESRGLELQANSARRQRARVRGLGFTTDDLDKCYTAAARWCIREQSARYISIGAALGLALGPEIYEQWHNGGTNSRVLYAATRAISILGAERAAAYRLAKYGTGSLQSSMRGNFITGLAVLAMDTGFSIYENGGSGAFKSADFYMHLGGGIGSLTLGLAVGTPVASWTTAVLIESGPIAPMFGTAAGILAGFSASAVGYVGGETAARSILEFINPAFLHRAESAAISDARNDVEAYITRLQRDPISG